MKEKKWQVFKCPCLGEQNIFAGTGLRMQDNKKVFHNLQMIKKAFPGRLQSIQNMNLQVTS